MNFSELSDIQFSRAYPACGSPATVKRHRAAGRTTPMDMLRYNRPAAIQRSAKRGAQRQKELGMDRILGLRTTCGART